jgi:hypothetical protein
MLPFGHTAVGYLLAKSSKQKLKGKETLLMIAAANVFDLDFLLLTILGIPGSQHHYYPGHTLLMGLFYWLIIYFIFRNKISRKAFIFIAMALLSHLVIDDFNYWLTLIGFQANEVAQIDWFYPLSQRALPSILLTNQEVFYKYLRTKLFSLEITAVIVAVIFYLRGKINAR